MGLLGLTDEEFGRVTIRTVGGLISRNRCSEDEALDSFGAACLRAWGHYGDDRAKVARNPTALLWIIAQRCFVDERRRPEARCCSLDTLRDEASEWLIMRHVAADDDPVEQAAIREQIGLFRKKMGLATLLALLLYEEMGGEALAAALQTTAGNVRLAVLRARRMVRPVPKWWHPALVRLWREKVVVAA